MLSRNLLITSGFSNITQNIGSVKITGVEVSLNGLIIKTNFEWDVSVIFAENNNESWIYMAIRNGVGPKWFIGQPIRVDYKLDYIGVWQTGDEVEAAKYGAKPDYIKHRDLNT